jgi:hypothetical protein
MTKQTKQSPAPDAPRVEIDEAAIEQRRRDTEALTATPAMQRAMEEGRLALEAELAAKAKAQDDQMDQWAARIAAEQLEALPAYDEAAEARDAAQTRQPDIEPTVLPAPPPPPPPEPVWSAEAQRAVPPSDPDDHFSVGTVTEVEVRLYNDTTDYRLVVVERGQEETIWTGAGREGWGAALAMKRIRVDKEADYTAIHRLPRVHPYDEKRQQQLGEWYARNTSSPGRGGGTGRQVYRDRDVRTGEFTTFSDGVSTWS